MRLGTKLFMEMLSSGSPLTGMSDEAMKQYEVVDREFKKLIEVDNVTSHEGWVLATIAKQKSGLESAYRKGLLTGAAWMAVLTCLGCVAGMAAAVFEGDKESEEPKK